MVKMYKYSIVFYMYFFVFIGQALAVDYTKEYQNSANFLDVINAKTAYDMGYTGAGVGVGVFDQATRTDHPEFLGKISAVTPYYLASGELFIPDWADNDHGTHVSGIIAAKRDGIGMHGVAYNANLYTLALLGSINDVPQAMKADFQAFFDQYSHVRIINNSWGTSYYPYMPWNITNQNNDIIVTATDVADITAYLDYIKNIFTTQYQLAQIAMNNPDKVFVFAEGNEGKPAGSIEEVIPRHFGTELNNWITVSSLNGDQITRDASGNLTLTPGAVAFYTNFVSGAERYSLSAPGSYIYSAYSGDLGYIYKNGTSMATPVVSGALALVQERFPWMTGKQLADTVLSTANNTFTPPDYTIQVAETKISDTNSRYDLVFNYIEKTAPYLTTDDLKQMVQENYDDNKDTWSLFLGGYDVEALKGLIDAGRYAIVNNVSRESIFGQGILDVGKAMGGIAQLDANRMTEDHVLDIPELGVGTKHAIMTLNTAGYDAEFSNDIVQFQWDDIYHHKEYQTGGTTGLNAAASALAGKNIGIRKSDAGRLVFSGDNTYSGATIVEGGELTIATRVDGSGGVLENSIAIVRSQGTLSGNGTIQTNLINSGVVAPGLFGLADPSSTATTVLHVENYTQQPDGILQIYFDAQGNHGTLHANTSNILDGKLMLSPWAGFYTSGKNYTITALDGVVPTGTFSSIDVEKFSPTLNFELTALTTGEYEINTQRAENAYSQYAEDTTSKRLGMALASISKIAHGDMQNLLSSLDFSSPNGQDVTKALKTLGPETYDNLSQLSLKQQNQFNNVVLQRMLSQNKARFTSLNLPTNGIAAGDVSSRKNYQLWGQVFGSVAHQGEYDSVDGYSSSGVGFVTGLDYTWDSGLIAGVHAGFVKRSTTALGQHDAQTETESFSFGIQASFAPKAWGGFYAMAQGRLGFEQNEMYRDISIGSYARSNESQWSDFTGSVLVGGGKDWVVDTFSFGPLAWLEYAFVQRPDINESNGLATSLKMDAAHYNSLRTALGVHVGYADNISETLNLEVDVLAVWHHELLDGNISTTASFADYSDMKFTSKTPLLGRNTYSLQASVRLNHINDFFTQFDVGGEMTDGNGQALTFGLKFGYNF